MKLSLLASLGFVGAASAAAIAVQGTTNSLQSASVSSTKKVWLAINAHTGASCSNPIFKFAQLDMGYYFAQANVSSAISSLLFQEAASELSISKSIPTSLSTCKDFENLGNMYSALQATDGGADESDFENTAMGLLLSGFSASAALPEGVFKNLGELSKGKCVSTAREKFAYSLSAKCYETERDPAFPSGKSPYVTTYSGMGQTSCSSDLATIVSGQLADGVCYSNNILAINGAGDGGCWTASCTGKAPNITFTDIAGALQGSLPQNATSCNVDNSGATPFTNQVMCVVGSEKSLVAQTIRQEVAFSGSGDSLTSLAGNLGMKFSSSGAVVVNVTVGATPEVAKAPPSNGINTYYHFQVPTGTVFSALISFTYDDSLLNQFQYKPDALKWAVYNELAQEWQVKSDSKYNPTSKSVEYTTTGFSEWTIVATTSASIRAAAPPLLILLGLIVSFTAHM
ncbi:hypothetical protein DFS34DRAFT_226168 [Phlyctochytrium arcticum]|nr:hypothetical protein DFS34DRAFT_226168 [Phlyctochytrium arcticum]